MQSMKATMVENDADKVVANIPPSLTIYIETYIKHLVISNRALDNLPDEIGNIVHLQTLDVSYNNLQNLPQSLEKLEYLETLNASSNAFVKVPEVIIKSLTNLKKLNLCWNWLREFNTPPASYSSLKDVNFSNNLLVQIPIWMFHPKSILEKINVESNKFFIDLESIEPGRLNNSIKYLNVGNCSVRKTDFLLPLSSLEELCLGNQQDETKHNGFNCNFDLEPKHLLPVKRLACPSIGLSLLPTNFSDCVNLTYLDLSHNALHFLPCSFGNLNLLQVVNFTGNRLAGLPDSFIELKLLETLLLSQNNVEVLPNGFDTLTSLKNLDLYGNNLLDCCAVENMNLEAIDLEMNFISENCCTMEGYKSKNEKLRKMFNVGQRFLGQKALPASDTSISSAELHDDGNLDYLESLSGHEEKEKKNWDEVEDYPWEFPSSFSEEDANELFDPNVDFSHLRKTRGVFSPLPEIKNNLTYVDMVVEGQFDDL